MNWDTYLFHCSSLPTLLTKSRTLDPLSETAKAALREIWIKETYGRENFERANKFTEKGLLVEQDSLDMATRVLNQGFLAKNKQELSNDFVIGTPDVTKPLLLDIKSSWNLWTYAAVDEDKAYKDYYWQLWGYMWLTGQPSATLAYVLCNTPVELREQELYRLTFKNLNPEDITNAEKNYVFDDIPESTRVKIFNFAFDESKQEEVEKVLTAAREYLKNMEL